MPTEHRPPMDGDLTADIGMMSVPIWFEHGDVDGAVPAFGMSLEVRVPIGAADLGDEYLRATYSDAAAGYSVQWIAADTYEQDGSLILTYDVDFAAIDGYADGAESLESYVDRVIAATPFYRVYNDCVIFFTAEHAINARAAVTA